LAPATRIPPLLPTDKVKLTSTFFFLLSSFDHFFFFSPQLLTEAEAVVLVCLVSRPFSLFSCPLAAFLVTCQLFSWIQEALLCVEMLAGGGGLSSCRVGNGEYFALVLI
jgi:hypothetical protein